MTNSDLQISEVIALNPSFTMFSSKINVRDLILKEFPFVYIYGVSSPDRPKITKWLMVDLS